MAESIIDRTDENIVCIEWARDDVDGKTFKITDAAGVAVNISAWTLTLTVNSLKNPGDVAEQQFTITGVLTTDGTDGRITFTPAASDTDITPGKYYYDIQRDSPGKKTLVKGVCLITQDITKT